MKKKKKKGQTLHLVLYEMLRYSFMFFYYSFLSSFCIGSFSLAGGYVQTYVAAVVLTLLPSQWAWMRADSRGGKPTSLYLKSSIVSTHPTQLNNTEICISERTSPSVLVVNIHCFYVIYTYIYTTPMNSMYSDVGDDDGYMLKQREKKSKKEQVNKNFM